MAVLGLAYLYQDYSDCGLGMFFIIVTMLMGLATTIVSLLESVGRGLLTPCMMFAYSVFMCWYALLSSPKESCNPTADSVGGSQDVGIVVVSIVSMVILLYCVFNGSTILNIFNPNGEGVMMSYSSNQGTNSELASVVTGGATDGDSSERGERRSANKDDSSANNNDNEASSGTPHERVLYHVIMILVACYGAMILTNWGKTNGSPAQGDGGGDDATSNESMWLKILSQW
eukprot:CAMPEP_0181297978 /NCGR_PEP_ID=MMETSP1101-20121128/5537_1 /TAXON_ID=46948 /ORGANISM="Rhodomonas abbreviata, Strain Caron Lab Isolate" /LENGTH=229 /DNA_ID=CAMNT_0023402969 /DNA_START=623 /DNA_END=1309 /DNA_ORIENTATION=-